LKAYPFYFIMIKVLQSAAVASPGNLEVLMAVEELRLSMGRVL
jgi:hypothetical protein